MINIIAVLILVTLILAKELYVANQRISRLEKRVYKDITPVYQLKK